VLWRLARQAGDLCEVIDILAGHVGLIQFHGQVPCGLMAPGPLPLALVEPGEIGGVRGA